MLITYKLKFLPSHSFCFRRKVNEHETELTVMKLPTNYVESMCKIPDKSVLPESEGTSATYKDQPFLGQTYAYKAWRRRANQ